MLANLLTTLCFVALVVGLDDEPYHILKVMGINPSQHITVSTKVSSPDLQLHDGPHYYIAHADCRALLDTKHLCGREGIKGIEVRVSDHLAFARVDVYKKMGMVIIQRQGVDNNAYCPGVALVDVRLSCDHYKFSNSRNRLRLPGLLASDEEDEAAEKDQHAV